MTEGDAKAEKIAQARDDQRDSLSALSRDIAAVKKREEAASGQARKKDGERARLSDSKAAVRDTSNKSVFFMYICTVFVFAR